MHIQFCILIDNIDYISFVTWKSTFEKMMNLNTKEIVFTIIIFNLDVKLSTEKKQYWFLFLELMKIVFMEQWLW